MKTIAGSIPFELSDAAIESSSILIEMLIDIGAITNEFC